MELDLSLLKDKLFSGSITKHEVKLIIEYVYKKGYTFNRHPLGFIHYKIYENAEDKTSLRLHIWPAKDRKYQDPRMTIHDHIFAMTSYVVMGVQTNVVYKVEEDTKNALGKLYKVEYDGSGSTLINMGKSVSYIEKSRESYSKDQTYSMINAVYHQSDIPEDILTCTLVTIKNELSRSAVVIGPVQGGEKYFYKREDYPFKRSQKLLKKILKDF